MTPPATAPPPRWLIACVIAAAAFAASALSFSITITPLAVSPVFVTTAAGMVLLARFGRWAWPAFALGNALGEVLVTSRSAPLILITVMLHTGVAVAGATWVADHDAWPDDLRTSVRFLLGAVVLAVVTGLAFGVAAHGMGDGGSGHGIRMDILWATVGVLVGYLVGGATLAAWLRPTPGPSQRLLPAVGFVVVSAAAVLGLAGPVSLAAPIALLGTLLITARAGRRWGSSALVVVAACAFVGAERGLGPMGGGGNTTRALADVMVTLALFGGLTLLLGGYRNSGAAATRPVATTALLFAGMMLVAGIAGVGANEVVVADNAPLVVAGMFTAASAIGLFILRSARAVEQHPHRRGAVLASFAGAFYALNLALLFGAMPLIGAGAATALAMISPLPVMVLSVIFLRLQPSWLVIGAIGIIVAGAVVAALGSLSSPLGIALALASAVAFAGSVILTRKALITTSIVDTALVSTTSAAVCALVAGAIISGPGSLLIPADQVRLIALAAIGAQLVPILGRTWALQHMGADLVGAEGVLAPATTAMLSFWLISPADTTSQWVGLVVIAGGAVLAALAGGRGTPAFARRPRG